MNKSPKFLSKLLGEPVIGDSMILYKAVWQYPSGELMGSWDKTYQYKIGQIAKPRGAPCPSSYGVCASGMHAGSMDFAREWRRNEYVPRGSKKKSVILACQVRLADMLAYESDGKVRCTKILPLGIVQE